MKILRLVALLLWLVPVVVNPVRGTVTSQVDKTGPFLITSLPQTIPVGFPFVAGSQLLVLDTGPTASPYDPARVLTLGSDYTVTGGNYNTANQMQSGSVVVVGTGSHAVAVNDYIVIMRNVPINQTSSFTTSGPLTVTLIEQALDKMATLSQQVNEVGSRSLQFENFEFGNPTLYKNLRSGKLLGFNSVGLPTYYDPSIIAAGTVVTGSYVLPDGANTSRTLGALFGDYLNVKDFGAVGDGVTDDLAAINAAITQINTTGGVVYFPAGNYYISDTLTVGNGTNSTNSTTGNRIRLLGAGRGAAAGLSGQQAAAVTTLTYHGAASASKAVVEFAGPLHSVGVKDIELNANNLAGIGLNTIHCTDFFYQNVVVRNWTATAYVYTTRTGFPSGAPFGCSNGVILDCFSYDPDNTSCGAILLTSGVNTASSLAGNPDSANNDFISGVYFYGGAAGSKGIYLYGCDENTFRGIQAIPQSNTGGNSVYFTQWPGSTGFPSNNTFYEFSPAQDVGGASGTYYNQFYKFNTGEGAAIPTGSYLIVTDSTGHEYDAGNRLYRERQELVSASSGTQTVSSTVLATLKSQAITTRDGGVRVLFTCRGAKAVGGSGYVQLNIDGIDYGATRQDFGATSFNSNGAISFVLTGLSAGAHTVVVKFASSDTDTFSVFSWSLVVEELF